MATEIQAKDAMVPLNPKTSHAHNNTLHVFIDAIGVPQSFRILDDKNDFVDTAVDLADAIRKIGGTEFITRVEYQE